MKKYIVQFLAVSTALFISPKVQSQDVEAEGNDMMHWQHASPEDMVSWGVSSSKAHKELFKSPTKKTIVVAVIDGGVDTTHPDLKANMWTNQDEIPGNGQDDDRNGYIDDYWGWNFIGGPSGDIGPENTEAVRIYKKWSNQFSKKTRKQVSKEDRASFDTYKAAEMKVLSELLQASMNIADYESTKKHLDKIVSLMGDEEFSVDELRSIKDDDESFMLTVEAVAGAIENEVTFKTIYEGIMEGYNYYYVAVNHHYNTDFDARHIVGDNPEDFTNKTYGNSNVMGPDASHGTHVAGIIGAVRNNDLGMDGIASDVRIMAIRAVPDGDERDKDVANAIRYAVDNGAHIINMSFGKSFSPNKQYVEDAIAYAASKNVLMVHAAGNDGANVDVENNFPNAKSFADKTNSFPWIEVGAISSTGQIADFSNYGAKTVDILAPGVSIYSTLPQASYDFENGTSMAAPVVSGVAALIWSHHPELTASDLKNVLMKSVMKPKGKTFLPGQKKQVPYKKICRSEGVVNAENAGILLQGR